MRYIFSNSLKNQIKCNTIGKPLNLPPATGSILKCEITYDPGNVYQQFYLVKLQN